MHLRRRLAAAFLAATTLVAPASATWTVVLVNSETREVIICSATCLADFDLQVGLPVVRVGEGAAAAQSFVDQTGQNRLLIWNEFIADTPPKQMIQKLAASDGQHQTRQYVIADWDHSPAGFTGQAAGPAKKLELGVDGPWRYSIAGNVLTAQSVIFEAEAALLATEGDGMQKVLAAMEAARALGGDGRCSCALFNPTSCGAPPAGGFTKTAHTGFLIVSRLGDVDGTCNASVGCANGDYFLDINVIGSIPDVDPILQIQSQYDQWRAGQAGVVDHYQSSVQPSADDLVADGVSRSEVTVRLADIEGAPLTTGGAQLTVHRVDADGAQTTLGPVTDLGDGSYRFDLVAGTTAGSDTYEITVDDGANTVLLWPPLEIDVDPLTDFHVGRDAVSVLDGATVPVTLNVGAPSQPYFVLASLSGTVPGLSVASDVLPLNYDAMFELSALAANTPLFSGTVGLLDPSGRATASVTLPAGLLDGAAGGRVDLAALLGGTVFGATSGDGFDLVQ